MTEQRRKRGVVSTDLWPILSGANEGCHVKMAEDVNAKHLKRYLCSEACPDASTLYLDACRTCQSPCAYGKRMVAIEDAKQ